MHASRKDLPVAPNGRHVVAIDIGQKQHAAAARTAAGQDFGRVLSFENSRAGVERIEEVLLKPLGKPHQILIGMEATGHYWMPLYFELIRRGYDAIVINPIQTRAQFRTRIRKTKTDQLDARAIAHLLALGSAKAARIPDASTFELRLLTRQRHRFVQLAAELENFALSLIDRVFPEYHGLFHRPLLTSGRALLRELGLAPATLGTHPQRVSTILSAASRNALKPAKIQELVEKAQRSIGIRIGEQLIVEQLRALLTLIESFETQIRLIDEQLETRVAALRSPLASLGLNAPLIATIHAESDPISDFRRPQQYAAFAGLDPSTFQTGNFVGSKAHISKRGSPYLRHALYLSAFAQYRRHKTLQRLYQNSRKKGHPHTDALVIVAHKLARIAWRLLTDNRPFKAKPPAHTLSAKTKNRLSQPDVELSS